MRVSVSAIRGAAKHRRGEAGADVRQCRSGAARGQFAVSVPASVERGERLPVVLSLHGRHECGTASRGKQPWGIGGWGVGVRAEAWRCVVVAPAKPDPAAQWEELEGVVLDALDRVLDDDELPTDDSRVVLTGHGQGGHGVWHLGARHAERFSALVPIAGYLSGRSAAVSNRAPAARGLSGGALVEWLASRVSVVPTWIVHGREDAVVPMSESEAMHQALRERGAEVRLTVLEGCGHEAWRSAYEDAELASWALGQRLGV